MHCFFSVYIIYFLCYCIKNDGVYKGPPVGNIVWLANYERIGAECAILAIDRGLPYEGPPLCVGANPG